MRNERGGTWWLNVTHSTDPNSEPYCVPIRTCRPQHTRTTLATTTSTTTYVAPPRAPVTTTTTPAAPPRAPGTTKRTWLGRESRVLRKQQRAGQ
ncbi:hypothetical protein M0R45_001832 [Rubus argutus]|uniref:Uncharacterized protein n=1 Tax=Rubus argutus TaxID=59490 RepID=A0AAW1VKT6_RUBAR